MSFCSNKHGDCRVETHTVGSTGSPLNITVQGNAQNQVIFEDFTCNHNKTLLQLRVTNSLIVTITTRNCPNQIVEMIPAGGTRIFQVEDFKRLSVSDTGGAQATLSAFIQKTFCICCEEDKKKHGKRNNCDRYNNNCDSCDNLSSIRDHCCDRKCDPCCNIGRRSLLP